MAEWPSITNTNSLAFMEDGKLNDCLVLQLGQVLPPLVVLIGMDSKRQVAIRLTAPEITYLHVFSRSCSYCTAVSARWKLIP